MNKKRFIKVTPQGEDRYIVLTAQNSNFYRKQGATVEQPTEEEILEFFPELGKKAAAQTSHEKEIIAKLEQELQAAKDEIARLHDRLKRRTKDTE